MTALTALQYKQETIEAYNNDGLSFVEKVQAMQKLSSPLALEQRANQELKDSMNYVALFADIALLELKKHGDLNKATQYIIDSISGIVSESVDNNHYLVAEIGRRLREIDTDKLINRCISVPDKPKTAIKRTRRSASKRLVMSI